MILWSASPPQSPGYPLSSETLLQSLLNSGLEGIWVGTDNLSNLLSILEQEERGHSANGELLSDIWNLVDVDLVEFGLRELVGESR